VTTQATPPAKPPARPRPVDAGLGCGVLLVLALVFAVPVYREQTRPPATPPWWANTNELGWELKHQVRPEGYDKVSTHIIRSTGLTYTQWDRESMRSYTFKHDLRCQWVGGKLLCRYVDGQMSLFDGGGRLHPPLPADPWTADRPLVECLAHTDDGTVLPEYHKRESLVEAMEAAGVTVVRPR
jgi:hypothetical protein